MSLVNTTTWATVSMSTIMSTPIWQQEVQRHGTRIRHDRQADLIRAALVFLGMKEDGNYSVERNVNIRSCNDNSLVYINTTLYTFAVKENCPFKSIYQKNDILHFGEEFGGWGVTHIKMDDFGNSYDPARADDNSI